MYGKGILHAPEELIYSLRQLKAKFCGGCLSRRAAWRRENNLFLISLFLSIWRSFTIETTPSVTSRAGKREGLSICMQKGPDGKSWLRLCARCVL